jgi:uncharacterized SAM-binding protein YcdF (DUF218 family)
MAMESDPPRRFWRKKSHIFLSIGLGLLLMLLLLHRPILRGMGDYLIVQDTLAPVEAIFVLSGNPFDRGAEAAKIFHGGWGNQIVCLGGETNPALTLYGIRDLTYESTYRVLQRDGVPASAIDSLPEGTSTFEEFVAIQRYCKARNLHRIMVVSSLFHTRRIDTFFRLRLHLEGIEMVLRGAHESEMEEDAWWQGEPGLLFVNNEYIKLLYYWLKY